MRSSFLIAAKFALRNVYKPIFRAIFNIGQTLSRSYFIYMYIHLLSIIQQLPFLKQLNFLHKINYQFKKISLKFIKQQRSNHCLSYKIHN